MSIQDELGAITRRAFVPKIIEQIYNTSPLLSSLLNNANDFSAGTFSVQEETLGDLVRRATQGPPRRESAYEHPKRDCNTSDLLEKLLARM